MHAPVRIVSLLPDELVAMTDLDDRVALFETYRDRLHALAYRMLGTRSDAKDLVQEAFIRWQQADVAAVRAPGAYLTRVVTNLCVDALRSARKKREEYIGPWLPEPIETDPRSDPSYQLELADSLSMAFLRLLETLSPPERAVFLLREVFRLSYEEVAQAVDTTPGNCRQIAFRARQRIGDEGAPRFDASAEERDRLMYRFEEAIRANDLRALKETLAEDIAFYADGGGKAVAARRPLFGVEEVSRFLLGVERKYGGFGEQRPAQINGEPGLVFLEAGVPRYAWSFHIEDGRIRNIFVVANPDKLGGIYLPRKGSDPR